MIDLGGGCCVHVALLSLEGDLAVHITTRVVIAIVVIAVGVGMHRLVVHNQGHLSC
jgi:fatty-acid desaturase